MKKRKGCRLFRSLMARCKRSNPSDIDVAKTDNASASSDELLNAQQQAAVTMQQQPQPGSPSTSSASSASSTSRKPFKKKEKSPGGRSKKNKTPKSSAASADIEVIASTEVLSTNMGRSKLQVQQKNKRLPSMTHLRMRQDASPDVVVEQPTVVVHADQQGVPQALADIKNTTEQPKSVVEISLEKSPVRADIVGAGKKEMTPVVVVRPAEVNCNVTTSERLEVDHITVSPDSNTTMSATSVSTEQKMSTDSDSDKTQDLKTLADVAILPAADDGSQINGVMEVKPAELDSSMPKKSKDLTELAKSQPVLSTESVSTDTAPSEMGLALKTRKLPAVPSDGDQTTDASADATEVMQKRSEKVDWTDFGKPKEKPVDVGSTEFGEIFSKVRKQRSDLSLKGQQNGVPVPGEIADREAGVGGGKLEPKLSLTKTDSADNEMPKILTTKLRSSSRKIGIADQVVIETEGESGVEIQKEPTRKLPSTSNKIVVSNPTSGDSIEKTDTLKIHKSSSLQKSSESTTGAYAATLPKSKSLNEKERQGTAKTIGTEEAGVNTFAVSLKPLQSKKITCVVDEKPTPEPVHVSPLGESKSKPPKPLPAKLSTLERRKKPVAEKEDNATSPEDPDVTVGSETWQLKKPPPSGRMATPNKKEMLPLIESDSLRQLTEQVSSSSTVSVGVRPEAGGSGTLKKDGHQRKISIDRPLVSLMSPDAADAKKGQSSVAVFGNTANSSISASVPDISGKRSTAAAAAAAASNNNELAAEENKPLVSNATLNITPKNVASQDEKSSTGEAIPLKFSVIPKAKISVGKATGGNSAKSENGNDSSRAITESSLSIAADSVTEKTPLPSVTGKKPVVKRPTAKVQPTETTPEEPAWVVAAKRKSKEWSSGVFGEDLDRRESEKLAKKTSTESAEDDSSFQRFGNRGSVRDIVKKLQGQQPIS